MEKNPNPESREKFLQASDHKQELINQRNITKALLQIIENNKKHSDHVAITPNSSSENIGSKRPNNNGNGKSKASKQTVEVENGEEDSAFVSLLRAAEHIERLEKEKKKNPTLSPKATATSLNQKDSQEQNK